jgi:hypothetical protein
MTIKGAFLQGILQDLGDTDADVIRVPNTAMLQALSDIEEIRKGMNPRKGTKDYLREARSGGMYGFGDDICIEGWP